MFPLYLLLFNIIAMAEKQNKLDASIYTDVGCHKCQNPRCEGVSVKKTMMPLYAVLSAQETNTLFSQLTELETVFKKVLA